MTTNKAIYKIIFMNQNSIYEIYAKQVNQSNLLGFVEAEELIFGDKESIVVDPGEERLKTEFACVKRTYIPLHLVLRIDEVQKEGIPKIKELGKATNIAHFPNSIYPPKE